MLSRILVIVLTLIFLIGGLYLGISTLLKNQNSDKRLVTLTIWGIKDDESVMKKVIVGYQKLHPNVTINYSVQSLQNYRTRVQSQIAAGQAADIVAIHNSWTPMFFQTGSLAPAPTDLFGGRYSSNFYKVVADSLASGGKIYAVPTEIDGIALFYNQDILKGQNIGLPKTWDDVANAAVITTVVDKQGVIKTGGLGIGNTKNVDFWSEIVGLLFLQQPNTQIDAPANSAGQEVIQFFKNPSGTQQKKVWDENMPSTTQAFAEGKLTFYLGSASKAREIRAKNPALNFGVMAVPQLPDKKAAFACFWGYGVSSKSSNTQAAWQFLKFLTDIETEKYIFEEESKLFGMGRPYPRVDLEKELDQDSYLGGFVKQGPLYKSFYLCPETLDNGLNDKMIEAFKAGVDSGNLNDLQGQIAGVLGKYAAPVLR